MTSLSRNDVTWPWWRHEMTSRDADDVTKWRHPLTLTACRAQSGTGKTATFSIAALQSVDIQVRQPELILLFKMSWYFPWNIPQYVVRISRYSSRETPSRVTVNMFAKTPLSPQLREPQIIVLSPTRELAVQIQKVSLTFSILLSSTFFVHIEFIKYSFLLDNI